MVLRILVQLSKTQFYENAFCGSVIVFHVQTEKTYGQTVISVEDLQDTNAPKYLPRFTIFNCDLHCRRCNIWIIRIRNFLNANSLSFCILQMCSVVTFIP